METNAIQNTYDGPVKPRKIKSGQFSLDFAYSTNASEIDTGIRETIRGVKLSIMAMGVALYRVDVSGLFVELGFTKFGEYIDHLAADTGMSRTNLYNWEYIGEAYITHRSDLDKIGFSDDDGPTKLPFLKRALENHPKRDVFKNLKDMSKNEFDEWSRPRINKNDKRYENIKIKENAVYVGNSPIVSFADTITPKERRYYEQILLESATAIEQNEFVRIYRFYDETEAAKFDKIYRRELKALRTKI